MVSLYRPGPMELIPDFIARKHGRAKITYEHPAMETFTRETYGIMVYQEQIMQIASEMGGFTMGEADTLRRAMGKKDRDLMAQQRQKFIAGCKERGTATAKAERVWELMEKFAGYGFNKCLAADTWVEMADGSRKPITAVREGDVVLTKDGPHAGAARAAQRHAAGRPPGPGQRHGAAVHTRSSDLHPARVGERAEARARTTRWRCSTRWRPRICGWRPAVGRGRRAAAWCWPRCRSSGRRR